MNRIIDTGLLKCVSRGAASVNLVGDGKASLTALESGKPLHAGKPYRTGERQAASRQASLTALESGKPLHAGKLNAYREAAIPTGGERQSATGNATLGQLRA